MEFVQWYLAPWRKIARGPFNLAIVIVTIPGLLFWLSGAGDSMAGLTGLVTGMADVGQQLQNAQPDTGEMTRLVNDLVQPSQAPAAPAFDWSAVGGWVNALLWLACGPLVRMRVRDLGFGNQAVMHWLLVAGVFAGTVADLLRQIGVPGLESAAWMGSIANFVVLLFLSLKKAPEPNKEEHFIYTPPQDKSPR